MTSTPGPFTPCEPFHPGEYVRDEIKARDWSLETLSRQSGIDLEKIYDLLGEGIGVNKEIAEGLGRAFGTNPITWLNLQAAYDRAKAALTTPACKDYLQVQ